MSSEVNIIEQYIIDKKLEYKVVNSHSWPQILLKRSPITGEEKWHHFYINATNWMWDDKKAQRKGNFNQFRELYWDDFIELPEQCYKIEPKEYRTLQNDIAIQFAQRLHSDFWKDLLWYLVNERWLSEETLLHFKIGTNNGRITIPIFDKNWNLVNIRSRKDPKDTNEDNPRYMSETWCRSILFNEKCLNDEPAEVYLLEWEVDAMQLYQRGFVNVMSVTLGAWNFMKEWIDELENVKRINVCFDTDSAWIAWAKNVANLLWPDRVRIIELPKAEGWGKMDVSDFFVKYKHTREDFMKIVNQSKVPDNAIENQIKHVSEYNEALRKRLTEGEYTGISTWYTKFDEIVWGFRKGRVVVLSWLPSVGKTSASICLSLSLAQRNIPSIFITTEMSPIDIYRKFLLLQQKIPWNKIDTVQEGSALMTLIDNWLHKFKGDEDAPWLPLYIMDSVGQITLKKVLDVCKIAKEKHRVEVIFIDHLHYFATSMKNQEQEISNSMKQIKAMALELDTPIVLLAHIGREWRSKQRRWLYIPTMQDLKGSSAIEQDADQIVFVCRDSEAVDDAEKRKAVWKTAKNRDWATGHTSMDFDQSIWFFSEVNWVDYMQVPEEDDKPKRIAPRLRTSDVDEVFWNYLDN